MTMEWDPNVEIPVADGSSMLHERTLPMPGQVLQAVDDLDSYDAASGRWDTIDMDQAKVTTSMIAQSGLPLLPVMHKPVLDLDMPCKLIPSSTPGHFHLYIDQAMSWDAYRALLHALAAAGLIEQGYLNASLARGHTAVRLPWVQKPLLLATEPF